uniref:Uncharacterized protein n=1 Tax=Picea glauca TaxID=3330 RepID=A0A124GNN6_PICGL|nr:hypothetical protein ABT39_MTgene3932 [Picea glauca]QHR91047.1 hypothetical protein Q903MT_gene5079 [Picea sitchensis]
MQWMRPNPLPSPLLVIMERTIHKGSMRNMPIMYGIKYCWSSNSAIPTCMSSLMMIDQNNIYIDWSRVSETISGLYRYSSSVVDLSSSL